MTQTKTVSTATIYPFYLNTSTSPQYYLYFEYDNLTPPGNIKDTKYWAGVTRSASIKSNSNSALSSVSILGHSQNDSANTFSFKLGIVTSGNIGSNSAGTYIQVYYQFMAQTEYQQFYVNVPITYGIYAAPTITNISPSSSNDSPYSVILGQTQNITYTITQDSDNQINNTYLYQSGEFVNFSVPTFLYYPSSNPSSDLNTGTISPNNYDLLSTMTLGNGSNNQNTLSTTLSVTPSENYADTQIVAWQIYMDGDTTTAGNFGPVSINYKTYSGGIDDNGTSPYAYFYYKVIDPSPTCNSYSNSIYPNRVSRFDLSASGAEGITYNWQIYDIVGGGSYSPSSGTAEFYSSQPTISFTTPIMSTTLNTATYDVTSSYSEPGSNYIQFTISGYNRPSISFPNNITSYYLYTGQTIDISVNVIVDSNITTASTIGSTNYNQVALSGNIQTQGTYGTLTVPSFSQAVISSETVNVPDISYTAYQSPKTDSVSFFYIDTFNQNVTNSSGYTVSSTLTINIINGTPVVSTNTTSNSYPNRDVSFSITSTVAALNGTYPNNLEYSFNPDINISPLTYTALFNQDNTNYVGNFSYILPTAYYNTLNSNDISYIVTNPLGNNDNSGNISFTISPYTTPTYDSSLQTYTVLAGETLSIPFKVYLSQYIASAGTNYNQVELSANIITPPSLGNAVLNTQTYNPFPSTSPIIYDISYEAGNTLGNDSFTFNIQDTFNKDVTDSNGNTGNIILNINIKNPTQVSDMLIDCSENTGTNNSTSQVYMDLSANDGSGYYPLSMIIKTVPLNGNLYYKSNSDSSFNKVIQGGITIGQMTDANTYNFELYYQGNLYYYGSDSFTWYAIDNESFSSSTATNTISIQYVNVPPTAISYDVSLVSYYNITDISKGTPVELPYTAVNRSLSDLSFILQSYSSDISYATLTKELITYYPYTLPEVNLSDTGGYEKNNVGVIDNTLVNLDKDHGFTFNIQDPSGATSNTGTVGVYIIPYLENTGVDVIKNGSGNIYLNTEYTYLTNNGTGYTFSYYIKSNVSHGKLTYNGIVITSSTSPFITTNLSVNSELQLGLPILYTPNNNYTGNDSFTWYIAYTNANNGYKATSNIATVSINIPVADSPPVAPNKTYTIKLKN